EPGGRVSRWIDRHRSPPTTLNGANRLKYNSSFRDRQAASAKAKAAILEKFRAAARSDNPERKAREEARVKIVEARQLRTAEREAARHRREKALPNRPLAKRSGWLRSNAPQRS